MKKIKLAIVSTTIRGDGGYRDWDKELDNFGKFDAKFFIAADKNSIHFNDKGFLTPLQYLSTKYQEKYKCSKFIGWKRWARRNIALLEALQFNPDYVLIIDDDNRPVKNYFQKWYNLIINKPMKILDVKSKWFNYLDSGDSKSKFFPRGFLISKRDDVDLVKLKSFSTLPENIFLFQGISYGDPDIDAFARISDPTPMPLSKVENINYVVKSNWSPYNTQNTLFKKELAPLAFTWPNSGRYEDIYSSYVWQHFIFTNKKYVHVGDSVNIQERGKRDNFRDFSLEHEGYLYAEKVWNDICTINGSTVDNILNDLSKLKNPIIHREKDFFNSYRQDLKNINIL